jgi:inner membrane protein
MDSLTQIVLGAAVGEVCLGKKLGNKAMVWGAIAGTIPDLDILGNLVMTELNALAFHRGISHSIFFAVTFSFLIAYIAKQFYDYKWHKLKWLRMHGSVFATLAILLFSGILVLIGNVAGATKGLIIMGIPALLFAFYFIRRVWKSFNTELDLDTNISYKSYYNFFFWAIFTHPILDCFTVYGTQLFAPFSNYRVSFDNISVADPIYTCLFGVCLLIASSYHRLDLKRRQFNYLGIALSSLYLLFTFYNKEKVNAVLERTLEIEQIAYERYITSPTILNNILWSASVDADSSIYIGQYSLLDKEEKFDLKEVPRNYHLLEYPKDNTVKVLEWFSKDYCAVIERDDGKLQINDLRYGQFDIKAGNTADNYIFRFVLEHEDGKYELGDADGGPPPGSEGDMLPRLWNRIKGENQK